MTYILQSATPARPQSIEEAFPELESKRTTTYHEFTCGNCGERNGTDVFLDGETPVVVCGNCYHEKVAI